MKIYFFFKVRSKTYNLNDDSFNLFFVKNKFVNYIVDSYSIEKKLNFDFYSLSISNNYMYIHIYKKYYFNNILINYFIKYFYSNKLFSSLLNNFYIFNCCFYNFYIENLFYFYKILSNDKNHFFWFFIRTFKKKKKKKLKKKRKKKIFKFKFKRFRRFKFKRFRKHTKSFKIKKKKLRKENFYNLNLIYYYNYISKINNSKKINTKNIYKNKFDFLFLENNFIKMVDKQCVNTFLYKFNLDKTIFLKKISKKNIFKNLNFKKNMKYVKLSFFKFKFKLKKYNKYKHIKKFKNYFVISINCFWNYFFIKKNNFIFLNILLVFLIKKLKHFLFFKKLKFLTKKRNKKIKKKKRWFFFKSKFFKKKKKYRYHVRYLFFKKHNIRKYRVNKYNPILLKQLYKIIFQKLLINFKLKPSIFMFNSFSKYNIYKFSKLYSSKHFLIKFINKNYKFFKLFKKNNFNYLNVYNNHTPVYTLNKNFIKKFRKIFKSYFSKKYNNHMHYYIIPMFEYIFKKKAFIKTFNLNIYKKSKFKKKFLYKKLLKIFKRNKILVLSRSINFNIFELCEIVLYSFYRKDVYLILNWFLRNFKNTHFTGHKNFLTFFKMIINDIFETYKNTFYLKGFYFIIRGKVGVTSNAKRKTIKFVIGSLNKSTKSQKIDFQQNVVKSISGSLGVSIILTY